MFRVRRLGLAFAVACALGLAGCGGGASESGPAPAVAEGSEPGEGTCPIILASQVDAVVGTPMTDYYERTPQGQSPVGASAVACDFDSGQGHTVKLLAAEESSSLEEVLGKVGASAAQCPALSGVGEQAVSCSGEGEATVIAVSGDRVVVAYRGGEPGGDALLEEATEIAKSIFAQKTGGDMP